MPFFPLLERFAGRRLREYLTALVEALERDRIVAGPGLIEQAAPGGRLLKATAAEPVRRCRNTSGGPIPGLSGTTPGSGEITFYDWDRTDRTLSARTATGYNDYPDELPTDAETFAHWEQGDWWVHPAGAGGGSGSDRCRCPEGEYEVEVQCGPMCRVMPKYWWVHISEAFDSPDPAPECDTNCELLAGQSLRLEFGGGEGTCEWLGTNGECLYAELRLEGDYWVLRLYSSDDCLLYEGRIAVEAFVCCGTNAGWEQVDGSCDLTLTLEPDPCTCCPTEVAECPPDGKPYCDDTDCCPNGQCFLWVDVDLDDEECPDPEEPDCEIPGEKVCSELRGMYQFSWEDNCLWVARGWKGNVADPPPYQPLPHYAELRLSGRTWTLTIRGNRGQVAVFEYTSPECEWGLEATSAPRAMTWVSGTCTESIGPRAADLYFLEP